MFLEIFLFELKYRLKRPATYIYFLIYLLLGLFIASAAGGGIDASLAGTFTGGGKNLANSPFNLHQWISVIGQMGLFAIAAIMGVPIFRDFDHKTFEIYFTKPISKLGYLGGRFLGSFLVTLLVLTSIGIGLWLGSLMPYVDADKFGPFELSSYIWPYLIVIVPFTFLVGTLCFSIVTLTKNQTFIYLNAIVILVLLTIAQESSAGLDNKFLGSLLDPSGSVAFLNETEYWTAVEKNNQVLPFSTPIALNLLIWQAIALLLLVFTYFKFSFTVKSKSRKVRAGVSDFKMIADTVTTKSFEWKKVAQDFSGKNIRKQFWYLFKTENSRIFRSIVFIALLIVAVFFMAISIYASGAAQIFETPTLPVTYQIISTLQGAMYLFVFAIIIFFSGEAVWYERSKKVNLMFDALPIPNWIIYGSKFFSLAFAVAVLLGIMMIVGLCTQVFQGFFNVKIGQYLTTFFAYEYVDLLLLLALSFTVQVVVNNKYLGFLVMVVYFFGYGALANAMGLEHKLFRYASDTGYIYSDMNGYGHFPYGYWVFKVFWGLLAVLFAYMCNYLWVRGSDNSWQMRIKNLSQNIKSSNYWIPAVLGVLFVVMGGFIFHNTNVLNEYRTSDQREQSLADYEKNYKSYEKIAPPKIISVYTEINLRPKEQSFDASGFYYLKNKGQVAIDSFVVDYNAGMDMEVSFNREASLSTEDRDVGFLVYSLASPLSPGDSIRMDFNLALNTEGFRHSGSETAIVENGTFLNYNYFPSLGYQPNGEIFDNDVREEYDLSEKIRANSITDTIAIKDNLFGPMADWIEFEAIVSTEPDQIAIVPGYLEKEWEEDGRRYFHYKMDSKMLFFFNISSARYEVKTDVWEDSLGRFDPVAIEIYYHKEHDYNLEVMIDAVKASLAYYSESFGPYQHRQVRILEFPRYAGFAQSFANTIPFSESIGFIADLGDEDDVNYPFYVTAHEVAHQWWAHQVIGGNVQGFQFLSESMSEYAATMVLEKEVNQEQLKKYMKVNISRYLLGRTAERKKEMPVLLSENQQYIHYNKGSVVMYSLKDLIGEDSLNAALKRYVSAVKFQESPFTTTTEWLSYIDPVVPDSLKYVIEDYFQKITLFENKIEEATFEKSGDGYLVKIKLDCQKIQDDGTGEETDVPLRDYMDLVVFKREKVDGKNQDIPLYHEKKKITEKNQTFEIFVSEEPRSVGIDPWYKLIDKKTDDNVKVLKEENTTE